MFEYFFEIPVYSMKKDIYEKKINNVIEKEKLKFNLKEDNPNYNLVLKHIKSYKYREWQYNQIIGYLKFYHSKHNNRIYAHFWKINHKRIPLKLDNKYFSFQACYPEWDIDLKKLNTSEEIFKVLIEKIPDDITGFFKKYYLDMTLLKRIGPYIDWFKLLKETK